MSSNLEEMMKTLGEMSKDNEKLKKYGGHNPQAAFLYEKFRKAAMESIGNIGSASIENIDNHIIEANKVIEAHKLGSSLSKESPLDSFKNLSSYLSNPKFKLEDKDRMILRTTKLSFEKLLYKMKKQEMNEKSKIG